MQPEGRNLGLIDEAISRRYGILNLLEEFVVSDHRKITAIVDLPFARQSSSDSAALAALEGGALQKRSDCDGKAWPNFTPSKETINVKGPNGRVNVVAND